MAYMVTAWIVGIGTSFPGGFQEFMQEIESAALAQWKWSAAI